MENAVLSRSEFLKKATCGVFGFLAILKFGAVPVLAETTTENTDESDVIQSATAPNDHAKMWLNTGSENNAFGVNGRAVPTGSLCYWDEAGNGWKPTTMTWA